ncbi:MAG: YwaF family protein [Clostridia bacterium]|nr:YwaF family protein [Clostridia bacterium]
MREIIREFFGFGELGYTREPEGYMSWQHLTFVTVLMVIMVGLAVYFGLKYKHSTDSEKNKVLIWAAILIDGFELVKIVLHLIDSDSFLAIFDVLPLFLCSIQLITIPLAAFTTGRMKEASLDFVSIFGVLGAVLGTYLAGNNYAAYPVISFTNVVSGITHSISGFAALYIIISGMASMKKKNIPITYAILTGFAVLAYIANVFGDYNYMFLVRGDGTPYDLLYSLVGGNAVLYPIGVMLLFFIYILAFNLIFTDIRTKAGKKAATEPEEAVTV